MSNSRNETYAVSILQHLAAAGYETRFVGGCVRDALLGIRGSDIDLATTAKPEQVVALLGAAGIKTVPTGIDFGTVTAVVEGAPFEITTLRRDIKTDGRHAEVVYTTSWEEDAQRRDFTINALSRDVAGKLYDSVGGIADLKAGHIRFVGNAAARIKEDHLRLLRFFRFFAFFGKLPPDDETLDACAAAAPLLAKLSRERVWKEIKRLLSASNPAPACELMLQYGILRSVLPEVTEISALENLLDAEAALPKVMAHLQPDRLISLRRLTALIAPEKRDHLTLQTRLSLSVAEAKNLHHLAANPLVSAKALAAFDLRTALYRHGIELTGNFMLLAKALRVQFDWDLAQTMLDYWEAKNLPISGGDLLALGLQAGPTVGEMLRHVETWWIENSFQPDKSACLAIAQKLLQEGR